MKKITRKITVRFLAIISFLLMAHICIAQNLITNPGFESGSGKMPANWISVSRKSQNVIEWITDDVHSGEKAIKLSAVVPEAKGKSMGIYTDFFARAFVNVNEAKAARLGTDILTLVDEDKADFWTPLATGTLAGISERFGLGKVQAAMSKVTTGALNTIANRLIAGTAEGLTEYVQHGLEVAEESIGKGNDAEKVAFDFVDG